MVYKTGVESQLCDFARRVQLTPDSSIPLYYQLYRALQRFMADHVMQPEDRFPAEEAIAACFGVSRPTASKAIQEFVNQGQLIRGRGRETFIKKQPTLELTLLNDSLSLVDQIRPLGRLETQVLAQKCVPATPELSRMLELQTPNQSVIYLRRLRFVDCRPVMICDSYLPENRFPSLIEQSLVKGSLYATLNEIYDCPVTKSDRCIEVAEVMEKDVATLLRVPVFSPVFVLKGRTYTEGDVVIESIVSYIREGVSFRNTVAQSPPLASDPGKEHGRVK